jgi:hypothetical protein
MTKETRYILISRGELEYYAICNPCRKLIYLITLMNNRFEKKAK